MNIQNKIINDFDKWIALFGMLTSLVLIIILIHKPIFIIIGLLTFSVCSIWILIRKNITLKNIYISYNNILILNISFFLIFLSIIFILYSRPQVYEMPISYFIMTAILIGILSLEILFSNKNHSYPILIKIIIVTMIAAFPQLYIFPNVIGIDPWTFQMFVNKILIYNNIPAGFPYSNLPIFPIGISEISLFTGFNYKLSAIMISSVLIIIKSLLIFSLVLLIFKNHKIALIATLFANISVYNITMVAGPIPNTLGLIFGLFIIYLLFKNQYAKSVTINFVILAFMIILVLTHALTSVILALILSLIYFTPQISKKIINHKKIINFTIPIFFTVFMFTWWIYVSGTIDQFVRFFEFGFSIDNFAPITITPAFLIYQKTVPFIEIFFNNIGFFLYISLSFIGCFYMISKKYGNSNTFLIVIISIFILAVGFFTMIMGLTVVNDRWFYISETFLSIPLAVTIYIFSKSFRRSILASLLIICMVFLMIITPLVNYDNPTFSPNTHVRYGYENSELTAADFLFEKTKNNISTDYDFSGPINNYFYNGSTVASSKYLDNSIYNKNFTKTNITLVIRTEIINKPFRLFGSAYYKLNYNPLLILNQSTNYNEVYDNGQVFVYD